jgi:hypothetical protein
MENSRKILKHLFLQLIVDDNEEVLFQMDIILIPLLR